MDIAWIISQTSETTPIHTYRRNDAGILCFDGWVHPSEPMTDKSKYKLQRIISGIVSIYSATVAGLNLNLAGQLSAVYLTCPPPNFHLASHSEIIKYTDSHTDHRTNVGVPNGICYRFPMRNNIPMMSKSPMSGTFEWNRKPTGQWWLPKAIAVRSTREQWFRQNDTGSGLFADVTSSDPVVTLLPEQLNDMSFLCHYQLEYYVNFVSPTQGVVHNIRFLVYMAHTDPGALNGQGIELFTSSGPDLNASSYYGKVTFYAFNSITKIEVYVDTGAQNVEVRDQVVKINQFSPESSDTLDEGCGIIMTSGTQPGITFSVTGSYNFEFNPGFALKADLSPSLNPVTEADMVSCLAVQAWLRF